MNKTAIEGLAYSNALSVFEMNKNKILASIPVLEKSFKATATDRALNQMSLFGEAAVEVSVPNAPSMSREQELEKENEVLGVYLSGHPSQVLAPVLAAEKRLMSLEDLVTNGEKRYVATCGMINNVKTFYTKKGKQMAVFNLESQFATIPCVVFPDDMASCLGEIRDQNIVVITGSYAKNRDSEELQFIVNSIGCAEAFGDKTKPVVVHIDNRTEQTIVINYVKANPGNCKVLLQGTNGKSCELDCGVHLSLRTLNYLSGEFRNEIAAIQ